MARPGEGQEIDTAWLSGVLNEEVISMDCNACAEGQTGVTFLVTNIKYNDGPSGKKIVGTSKCAF